MRLFSSTGSTSSTNFSFLWVLNPSLNWIWPQEGIHSSGNVSELTKFFPSLDPGPSPQDYYHTTAKAPGGLLLEMIGCKLESLSALSLEIVDYKYQLDVISSSDECKGEE